MEEPHDLQEHETLLSTLFRMFRRVPMEKMQGRVNAALGHSPWETILLDMSLPNDETSERIFDAIMSSGKIDAFLISEALPANSLTRILQRALPRMSQFSAALFTGYPMNATEAQEIFSLFQTVKSPETLGFFPRQDYTEDVVAAYCKFVRESSSGVNELIVSWCCRHHVPMDCSTLFPSICEAVGQSTCIKELSLMSPPEDDSIGPQHLADAIARSTSLTTLEIIHEDDDLFDDTMSALLQTTAVQTFDLAFCLENREYDHQVLKFTRPSPWKPLLSKDIPLHVWPLILAETRAWNTTGQSHKTKDILYFLVREKNNELLQNVKKRKIRKRKRYQP